MTEPEFSAKPCTKCGETKPASEFCRCSKNKSGLASRCKSCERAYREGYKQIRAWWEDDPASATKHCSRCGEVKPVAAFSRSRSTKAGLASHCKDCARVGKQQDQAREAANRRNRERRKDPEYQAYMKAYLAEYRSKPDNKEKQQQYIKQWWAENQERICQYREENKEHRSQQLREWKQANLDKVAEYEYKRRMRKNGNGECGDYVRVEIFERDGWICQICFEPVEDDPTIDHIVPLVKGGPDTESNVRLAHRSCNSKKGTKT